MAMAVDQQQRHLGSLGFDHMQSYQNQPQFTNPWSSTTPASAQSQLFPTSLPSNSMGLDAISRQAANRNSAMSLPFNPLPSSSTSTLANSLPFRFGQQDLSSLSQDLMSSQRLPNTTSYGSEQSYSGASSPQNVSYAPTSAPYDTVNYSQSRTSPYTSQHSCSDGRVTQPSLTSSNLQGQSSFGDVLDAGRGMVAMSQDATPRNIYAPSRSSRGSTDSYGFPSAHSSSSSVSSIQSYPSYYGSVDSSVTDYSSASEMDMPSRTLPRPQGLLAGMPNGPQSMMGQFSSKVSSSTQKKHKCKICDKRFTRPSSLQTHMYSHTGEKPFLCEIDGCGRHFSVVSNLRRHRKVHKGERDISPDAE